jgi:hypothetical protein
MILKLRRLSITIAVMLGVMAATVEPALAGIYTNHCEPLQRV